MLRKIGVAILLALICTMNLQASTMRPEIEFGGKGVLGNLWKSGFGKSLVTQKERIMVLDNENHCVRVFNAKGELQFSFGKFGCDDGCLNNPGQILVDASGNMYVMDFYRVEYDTRRDAHASWQLYFPRIQKFDATGRFLFRMGRSGDAAGEFFGTPTDLAINTKGELLVLDAGNHRIQIFDANGKWLRMFGKRGSEPGCFDAPSKIEVDAQDYIYVLDPGNHRIQKFDDLGKELSFHIKSGLEIEEILTQTYFKVLADGRIAVLDSFYATLGNQVSWDMGQLKYSLKIKYFDLSGKFITKTDCVYCEKFLAPHSNTLATKDFVTLDDTGKVYVFSRDSARVACYALEDVAFNGDTLLKQYFVELDHRNTQYNNDTVYLDRTIIDARDFNQSEYYEIKNGINLNWTIDDKSNLSINEAVGWDFTKAISTSGWYYTYPDYNSVSEDRQSDLELNNYLGLNYNRTYDLDNVRQFGASVSWDHTNYLNNSFFPDYELAPKTRYNSFNGSTFIDLTNQIRWSFQGSCLRKDNDDMQIEDYSTSRINFEQFYSTKLVIGF